METNKLKKVIHKFSDLPRCYYLGERNRNRFIYKYIDLEALVVSLSTDSLRFVEPDQWEDRYEGRFYKASYVNVLNAEGNTPPVLACCFSYAPVNEAAWKLYSHNKTGLGMRCVKLKLNKRALREQIVRNNTGYTLYQGEVNYNLDLYEIENLHRSRSAGGNPNRLHDEVFHNFDLAAYLSLLLVKRSAFRHEQELRCFIVPDIPDLKGTICHQDVIVTWKDIVEGITVDEHCTDVELDMLCHVLRSKGIDITPEREYIYAAPEAAIVIEKQHRDNSKL